MSGDFPRNDKQKPNYALVFEDDFDSDHLDDTKWYPYYLPQWSSRARSKANYRFEDSKLILQITEDQEPWCPEFDGNIKVSNLQTGVYSGPLGSELGQHRFSKKCRVREEQVETRLFTPRYGYLEMRAKGLRNPNNLCALWMIGFEDRPERSAEICVFELKGWNQSAGAERSTVGFGIHPFGDPKIEDEFFEREFPIDASRFHIYAVDWSAEGVNFYIDNALVHTSKQSPDYPMQLMLNVYEIPRPAHESEQRPVYPSEFHIDYIRFYQKI
ncbi:glycoside hydrolase family 16 protein [Paenibacillus sp.]|uniref:glycoside hydrolase family 16 protein n=1 Tax=Paenibacillus sp. TaxID=58172 RepID=UPI002D26F095|nr:glycoside hydrolase family 16 protein [Paenibacillus sp.]HZG56706.1 glycoside hydrolase family 16 protein [Paenibacillus sp.]